MVKKFIDAEMLISELDASCMPIFEKGISGILGDEQSIADVIREQPSADVQEVEHGRWEVSNTELGYNNAEIPIEWECSLCDSAFEDKYLYCPHCGARMDGKEVEK